MTNRNQQPFFSVVIPLYNKANYISQCIKSVLDQSFSDFEIVMVDDGSTDGSVELVHGFLDDRIRLISQTNQGVSVARNTGITRATGRYVAFLDADDYWEPDLLETARRDITTYPSIEFWSCGYYFGRGGVRRAASFTIRETALPGFIGNYFDASLADPIVTSSTAIMSKRLLLEIGGVSARRKLRRGPSHLGKSRVSERTVFSAAPSLHIPNGWLK